jgi:hypothetical protein
VGTVKRKPLLKFSIAHRSPPFLHDHPPPQRTEEAMLQDAKVSLRPPSHCPNHS